MPSSRVFVALPLLFLTAAASVPVAAQGPLDPVERRIADAVSGRAEEAYALLERLVEINSGTLNPPGVRRVGEVLAERFAALGFEIEWVEQAAETGRGPHLVARRAGAAAGAPRALMIGHLDTVFEPADPFQGYERAGDVARGPGAVDMKGGDVAILLALEGLADAGALDAVAVTVYLTGDEEEPGLPLSASRGDLVEAAKAADVALGFESGCCREGNDKAVIARRSSVPWRLEVEGRRAHSSGIFSDEVGAGAAFEIARILHGFYDQLGAEEALTFNAGVLLAGTEVDYDPEAHRGAASGKTNVVPGRAVAHGGLRALTPEQLASAQARMREIASRHLPRTSATLTFEEGYPPMPPTEGNRRLLALYDQVSRDLGLGPVEPFPPAERGAADVSFAAPHTDALGGLGPEGGGSHGPDEWVALPTIVESAQRAALLLHRLAGSWGARPNPETASSTTSSATPAAAFAPSDTVSSAGSSPVAASAAKSEPNVVFLVRHAEKVDPYPEDPDDPPLTQAGRDRAELLARVLVPAGITQVLSSDLRRTRDTAAPLAEALGLEVELYDPHALEALVPVLIREPGRYLVVGHSNTTPRLAELLGGEPGEPINEPTEYDRLYVIVLGAEEPATVQTRYGSPSE